MTASFPLSRRGFLRLSGQSALAVALGGVAGPTRAAAPRDTLRIGTRILEVDGKAATVFGITNDAGQSGLVLDMEQAFDLRLMNDSGEATAIHWHGLTPPFAQDGTDLSQALVPPAGLHDYAFDLARAGTNWLHSHHGLQEPRLMAAPLVIRDADDRAADRQDVVIMLHDFSFTPPEELLAKLTGGEATHVGSGMAGMASGMMRMQPGGMAGMDHSNMDMDGKDQSAMSMDDMMQMDLNDIEFDAFLANDRDLGDPQIVRVERGGRVRLRIINGASSTNFWLDLGTLPGRLVAVDGMPVNSLRGTRFEIAMAQRLDIDIEIPDAASALPVFAQREGDRRRTGIFLATAGADIPKLDQLAPDTAPPVLFDLERRLIAMSSLPDAPVTRRLTCDLTGDMMAYFWGIDGRSFDNRVPLTVTQGDRVEITMRNMTMMSHPMHLHGHHFQVTGIGTARFNGAMRDTVLVPAMESVTIAFDANNPGDWPFHCHNVYHMAAGMMTTLRYD